MSRVLGLFKKGIERVYVKRLVFKNFRNFLSPSPFSLCIVKFLFTSKHIGNVFYYEGNYGNKSPNRSFFVSLYSTLKNTKT